MYFEIFNSVHALRDCGRLALVIAAHHAARTVEQFTVRVIAPTLIADAVQAHAPPSPDMRT